MKILNTTIKYQGKRLSLIEEELELPTGKTHVHVTVLHPGAVVIIPQTAEGKFLLVKQWRHSVKQYLLEFPAGTLEANEEPLSCAQREISEEVGVKAENWQDLGILFPAPGFSDEKQYCYLATGLTPFKLPGDEDEDISVVELSESEVSNAIANGELCDAKSIAIWTKKGINRS